MKMDKYNKRLISLVEPILNRLSEERKRYLEEELNNVINHDQTIRILMAYDIVKYLKKNNYSYLFRGNLDSSYLAYELGITNVDCFELNIIPERCYGIDYETTDSICFNVRDYVVDEILKYIDEIYKDKIIRLYSAYSCGTISLNDTHRFYVIDDKKEYKTKKIYKNGICYRCLKSEDIKDDNSIVTIIPFGHIQNELIDNSLRLIKKHYGVIDNLDDKTNIINQLCNYSYLNYDKLLWFEFGSGEINTMIRLLEPKSYDDLIKICGLHHSTGAWKNNQDKLSELSEMITSRDDVYDYLINNGFNKEEAFNVSEIVRKGKFKEISDSYKDRLPSSFIDVCNKIECLFPRGHVAAYVNQDILTLYLLTKYPFEVLEAYLKINSNSEYFNKFEYLYDKDQLIRYLHFILTEKEQAPDYFKWQYDEMLNGIEFRILLNEYDISEDDLLSDKYIVKTREEKIKELRQIKVDKQDYIKRLRTKYIKKGIEKTFEEQYLKAEGHELDYKFFSPLSSSRLCFELFSWMADDERIEDIEFEYYLPGLKSVHGYNVPAPNMDVYYEDDDIHFIESKFTEISLNKKEDISKNYYDYYLDGNNNIGKKVLDICNIRFDGNLIFAKHFIKFVNEILEYAEKEEFFNKADWFDLKQEISHIFGIGQYIYKYRPTKNIKFNNLVYKFDLDISNLAKKFKSLVVRMMNEYINELDLNILFFYDFEFMQDYVSDIDLDRNAFSSNKTIEEILSEYNLFD